MSRGSSHHIDHGFVGRRHDVGEEDVRADLPPRKGRCRLYRGRRLPSLQSRRDAHENGGGGRARQQAFQPFQPGNQSVRGAGKGVSRLRRIRHRNDAPLRPRRRRGEAVRRRARHLHRMGPAAGRLRPAVLRRPARRRRDRQGQHRAACRSQDRRRARHQSGMDPEAAPRPQRPRLYRGGGDRHHPAAHAGLRELHLSAIRRDRHQFPARADGRYVEPVHRALDSDAGRIDGGDPPRRIRAASIFPICCR